MRLQDEFPVPIRKTEDDIIQRWTRCAEGEPNERFRGDLGALVQIFAEAAKCREPWKQALKGWNMIVSETVQEWQAEALERGRGEGKIEGLLLALEIKFGIEGLRYGQELQNRPNHDWLDNLQQVIRGSQTIEELRKKVG